MKRGIGLVVALSALVMTAGCGVAGIGQTTAAATLTVYSGRSEALVGTLLERFGKETGIKVQVRYGDTAELAATILEEGDKSPADVFFAQDAGALGALSKARRLRSLPDATLKMTDERFRAPNGQWVGLSGRARVVVYNTKQLKAEDLPDTVLPFTDPKWQGRLGWAPTNASFQSFVTALRLSEGEAGARAWLEGIKRNQPKVYPNNVAIVDAAGKGEILAGFVNHYYLYNFLKEQGDAFPARNYHPRGGAGAMINVAGAGVLTTAKHAAEANRFIDFMLAKEAQQYFSEQTAEYPLSAGVSPLPGLAPLASITTSKLDLSSLADLEGTLKLLRDVGVL